MTYLNLSRHAVLCAGISLLTPIAVYAADFGAAHPAGVITSRAQAEANLADSKVEGARIDREYRLREAQCYHKILVNSCLQDARYERDTGKREVNRVRIEAHELQRRLDSRARDVERAKADSDRAVKAQQHAQDAAKNSQDYAARQAEAAQKEGASKVSPEQAVGRRNDAQKRQREADQRAAQAAAQAAQRVENVKVFSDRQVEAEKYAKRKEIERQENEKKRAEQKIKRDNDVAERAAALQKAEQSLPPR